MKDIYYQKNIPQDVEMEDEELVNEYEQGPSIFKSELERTRRETLKMITYQSTG